MMARSWWWLSWRLQQQAFVMLMGFSALRPAEQPRRVAGEIGFTVGV